ncbi:ribonuclease H [Alteromonadaceae bacterium BrNp21-10]|nr:ribonuclease H [Alteromonadaceae bacterium BrNp21-10]
MHHLRVFTDGSVNTQSKVGYGAYLVVSELTASVESIKDRVRITRFEQTSSTKLELQTMLWSLNEIIDLSDDGDVSLTVYTDSQNIIGLPARRTRLEQSDYFSSKNKRLNNFELYQEFYLLTSSVKCHFVKVEGHKGARNKNEVDRMFALVDKASRRALREEF